MVAAHEVAWRKAGQFLEFAREMRLVGIACCIGDIGPALTRHTACHAVGMLEAQDARHGLGRRADLGAEKLGEMAPADARLLGKADDRRSPLALLEPMPD